MQRRDFWIVVGLLVLCLSSGCSKRQILPGAVAGAGAVTFAAGSIYRMALPNEDSEGLFGKQPEQKAVTASLMLTGLALMTAGIIWSIVTPICEKDGDCWAGDVCEKKTKTCVAKPAKNPSREKAEPGAEDKTSAQQSSVTNLLYDEKMAKLRLRAPSSFELSLPSQDLRYFNL